MNKYTTVEELAKKMGNVPIDILIAKLRLVGVNIASIKDQISAEQEQQVLSLLQEPSKISLKRRSSVSQIKVKNAAGGNTTVNVVRKNRRVYVKEELVPKPDLTGKTEEAAAQSENVTIKPVTSSDQDKILTTTVAGSAEATADLLAKSKSAVNPTNLKIELEVGEKTEEHLASKKISESAIQNGVQTPAQDQESNKSNKTKAKKDKKEIAADLGEDEEKINKKVKVKASKTKEKSNVPSKINLNLLSKVAVDDLEDLEFNSTNKRAASAGILTRKLKNASKSHKSTPSKNLHGFEKPTTPMKYEIEIPISITVAELSQKMSVKSAELIKIMMKMGIIATINQSLDQETASLIVEEMGHTAILNNPEQLEDSIAIAYNCELKPRSPVVTVMGHVDHGKTSLLDYIRNSRVTAKEAGGITQHIGAYQVPTKNHGKITFLDTPGHSAFTAMRARGANCTDIVVLVVAADDSVMPQTVEAINHAKAAGVPIIVAINKMDKAEANPDQVINDLSRYGVMPEEWGGENIFIKISAKTGEGVGDLLESIALQAEILELTAPYSGPAQGVILESSLDRARGGIVATLLVQSGTLNKGDIVLAGSEYGRIKNLRNDQGISIDQAGPCMPVEVLGLGYAPLAGDKFQVVVDERIAKEVAERRQHLKKEELLSRQQANKFAGFMDKMQQPGEVKVVNIVLKADVQGSVEAIADALEKLSTDKVKVNIIGKSVGGFNESDVHLAVASRAFLLGFNVRAEAPAKVLAKAQAKEFNYYSVIYDLINAVQAVIDGSNVVAPKEVIMGVAEVREVFRSSKFGTIAGCIVKEGTIKRGNPIRVLRDNVVIYSGELESLRRFKENVNEARNGTECGIGVKNYNDVKIKDQIEVFEILAATKNPKSANDLKH